MNMINYFSRAGQTGNFIPALKQRLFIIMVAFTCSATLNAQYNSINLGEAAKYSVLGLEGTFVNLHNVNVNGGRVGVSQNGTVNMSSSSDLNDDLYLHTGVAFSGNANQVFGTIFTNQNLTQACTDARNAANTAAALTPTQTFSSFTTTMTITGNGGLNVIQVGDVNLSGSNNITLTGGPNDCFIINVTGSFSMQGSSAIQTSGVASSHVLVNVVGTGSNVTSHIDNIVNGTLLVLQRSVIFHGVAGQVICGGNELKLMSDCTVSYIAFYQPVNLGNRVWEDLNYNGVQDFGEPGIGGVQVKLYADDNNDNLPDGSSIVTKNTNSSGYYLFNDLTPGKYLISVTIPSKFKGTTTTGTSTVPDNDSDLDNNGVNELNGELFSNTMTLIFASEPSTDGDGNNGNLTLDFGLFKPSSVGDLIWLDVNGDGKQNHGEQGIANVKLDLINESGVQLATTLTNTSGKYKFDGLKAGSYDLRITMPVNYLLSPINQDPDDTLDNDFRPVVLTTGLFTLNYDQERKDLDGGIFNLSSLPVMLTRFTGHLYNNSVTLNWTTAQEKVNTIFEVERSFDGISFVKTGNRINGNGNTSTLSSYTQTDMLPISQSGKIYYRLKIINAENDITYSNIIVFNLNSEVKVTTYPNPVTSTLNVEINSTAKTSAVIRLSGMNGNIVSVIKVNLAKGKNQVTVSGLDGLPGGAYTLQLMSSEMNFSHQFIKKNQ